MKCLVLSRSFIWIFFFFYIDNFLRCPYLWNLYKMKRRSTNLSETVSFKDKMKAAVYYVTLNNNYLYSDKKSTFRSCYTRKQTGTIKQGKISRIEIHILTIIIVFWHVLKPPKCRVVRYVYQLISVIHKKWFSFQIKTLSATFKFLQLTLNVFHNFEVHYIIL